MLPSRQNTDPSERQIHQVVWVLERATELMGPGTEFVFQPNPLHQRLISFRCRTLALMIDYGDKAKSPAFSTSLKVITSPSIGPGKRSP